MNKNIKYGVVAALTLGAFVAPSVGAYTVSGGTTTYTEAEQAKIDACAKSITLDDEKNVVKGNDGKYAGVANTIYGAKGYDLKGLADATAAKKAVCVVDLTVNGTLIEEATATTTAKNKVIMAAATLAQLNGGKNKYSETNDTHYNGSDSVVSDVTDAQTIKWVEDGVYNYTGTYKGEVAIHEKNLADLKDVLSDKKKDLASDEKDLASVEAKIRADFPEADAATIKAKIEATDEYTKVQNSQKAVDTAEANVAAQEKTIESYKKAVTKAEKALSDAQSELTKAQAADKKTAAKAVETKVKAAKTAADKAVEEAKAQIVADEATLAKTSDKATAETLKEKIADEKEALAKLEAKAAALATALSGATSAADAATDEARDTQSISSATISGVNRAYTYTGKAIEPSIKVTKAGATLVAGTDYTVSYSNNTKVGTATVTVTGKGEYTGSVTKSFYIDPAKSKISKVATGAKKMTVTVKKGTAATGVQIAYRVKGAKAWSYTTTTSTSKTIKSLKKGKKYQVVVRSYVKKDGVVTNYSGWSATKTTAAVK